MLDLNSIMIGTMQPKVLAKFYEEVLEREPDWSDNDWSVWQAGDTHFAVGEHSGAKGKSKSPERVILNFETSEVQEEFERIKKIKGAKVVKEPYNPGEAEDMQIATFADPDGNYFQLMTPWEDLSNDGSMAN